MNILRSSNVFAAGMNASGAGVIVRFAAKSGEQGLYLYPTATDADLAGLLAADSPGEYMAYVLKPVHEGIPQDVGLVDIFEDAWGWCAGCDAVVQTTDQLVDDGGHVRTVSLGRHCPECQEPTVDIGIVRCDRCCTFRRDFGVHRAGGRASTHSTWP